MHQNKVFISHASEDYRDKDGMVIPGNAISDIIKVLEKNLIEYWIDESGLISSKGWCQQIEKAINNCNIFLFVSSDKANISENTANEIAYAINHKKHIIPIKLDKSNFHKDINLNLIRLHFLRYYEDRDKALRDLIATIKRINTDSVEIDTSVRIENIPDEKEVNGVLTSELLLSFFNAKDIMSSVKDYKSLTKNFNCESETGYKELNEYTNRFEKLAKERNYNVRLSRIERLVSDIKEDSYKFERCNVIMIILLKMYLYYYLDDIREVALIQKEINDVNFNLSYFEKNADKINETANAVIKGALFVGGIVGMCMGNSSLGGGAIKGASTQQKMKIVKTAKEIKEKIRIFETLKIASLSLRFFDD